MAEGAALRDHSSCVHGLGHGLLMQAEGGTAHGFCGGQPTAVSEINSRGLNQPGSHHQPRSNGHLLPAQPLDPGGGGGGGSAFTPPGVRAGPEAPLLSALDACAAGPRPAESCQCSSGVFMQVACSSALWASPPRICPAILPPVLCPHELPARKLAPMANPSFRPNSA